MMICQNCGQIMPDGVRFCANCGSPFHISCPPPQYPYSQMQPYYGQKMTNLPNKRKSPPSAKAIASLALGIVSGLLMLLILYANVEEFILLIVSTSAVGAFLGNSARKDAKRQGKRSDIAVAGMIVSLVLLNMIVISFVLTLAFVWLLRPLRWF